MKKIYITPFILILSSCIATQQDMIILQSQIDDLNTNIYTLKKNQADLSLKIDELNRNLSSFTENSKDLNIEMSQLSHKIDDYINLTDKKINTVTKIVDQKIEQKNKDEKGKEYFKETMTFYKSLSLYTSKKYELAKEQLKEYITKFPKGENIDLAHFYMAETLYELKDFKESAIFYSKIMVNFPSFFKMDYVKLKYAKSLLQLNDSKKTDEALTYLYSILKENPNSDEAKIANEIILSHKKNQKNSIPKHKK